MSGDGDRTVLVVDDDFHVARLHADLVDRRQGLRALAPVHTARAARAAVRAESPDLVLVDVHLPDGDGIALLAELDVDAFVVSAASDGATVRRALHAGALGYLIKPFDARLLAERLDAFVRYRNVLREDRAVDQEAVERALRILHSGDAPTAPSSRSATEQLVLTHLAAAAGELSALEVAERSGISRATAQRYLSGLAARDLVEMSLSYGSTGRPEHRYRLRSGD